MVAAQWVLSRQRPFSEPHAQQAVRGHDVDFFSRPQRRAVIGERPPFKGWPHPGGIHLCRSASGVVDLLRREFHFPAKLDTSVRRRLNTAATEIKLRFNIRPLVSCSSLHIVQTPFRSAYLLTWCSSVSSFFKSRSVKRNRSVGPVMHRVS